jgi:hypothetical protein
VPVGVGPEGVVGGKQSGSRSGHGSDGTPWVQSLSPTGPPTAAVPKNLFMPNGP